MWPEDRKQSIYIFLEKYVYSIILYKIEYKWEKEECFTCFYRLYKKKQWAISSIKPYTHTPLTLRLTCLTQLYNQNQRYAKNRPLFFLTPKLHYSSNLLALNIHFLQIYFSILYWTEKGHIVSGPNLDQC